MSPTLKEMIAENNASAMRQFYDMASDPDKMHIILKALEVYRENLHSSLNFDHELAFKISSVSDTINNAFLPLCGVARPSPRPWGSHEFDYDRHLARHGHFD